MLITRETDYAVRTVLHLARQEGETVSVPDIATAMQIPRSFLAKILQRLVRAGLVNSVRGVRGGFGLARRPAEISLFAIMHAIQGSAGINACAVEGGRCGLSRACAVHPVWVDLRSQVERRLRRETIARLLKL